VIDLKDAEWQDGFRAGDHGGKGVWTREDIDAAVEDFSPSFEAAPINTDHEDGGPAKGWIGALRRVGDVLQWKPRKIDAQLKADVDAERYIRQSIELYRKHPKTGRPYVRGIALLGNSAPAVRGLRPVKFSDNVEGYKDEAGNELVRLECDFMGGSMAAEKKPQDQDAGVIKFTAEEFQAAKTENEALKSQVVKLQSDLETFKSTDAKKDQQIQAFAGQIAELQNFVIEERRKAHEARVDGLITKWSTGKAPKVTPAEVAKLKPALMHASTEASIQFGDKQVSAFDVLVDAIEARPAMAVFGEVAKDRDPSQPVSRDEVRAKVQQRIKDAVKQGILKSETGPQAAMFADKATKELMQGQEAH